MSRLPSTVGDPLPPRSAALRRPAVLRRPDGQWPGPFRQGGISPSRPGLGAPVVSPFASGIAGLGAAPWFLAGRPTAAGPARTDLFPDPQRKQ
jgi:hypothetical protein